MHRSRLTWSLAILALTACGGSTAADPDGAGQGGQNAGGAAGANGAGYLPCDIETVMETTCQSCHGKTPTFGAPMSLVTYADLHAAAVTAPSRKVYELVNERIRDDAHPMPQAPYARLDEAQLAAFASWTSAGAPAADEKCNDGAAGAAGTIDPTTGLSCTPNLSLKPASPWSMPKDTPDVYVCYGVDVPAGNVKAVTGFVPRINNNKIVHHVLLFQSDEAKSPTPTPCSSAVVSLGSKLVYGWAPGGLPFELPEGVGMPLDDTTHYFLQVHYNNIQGLEGQLDESGFDLCTTNQETKYDADMVAFGTMQFKLPPHASTTRTCSFTWPDSADEVHAIAAFPHMHQLGTGISTVLNPSGSATDLGKHDPWDFNNQPFLPINATIKPGDEIQTICSWNNTTDSQVRFGEYTEDEMCYSFTMYYPRASSFASWANPSFKSECH